METLKLIIVGVALFPSILGGLACAYIFIRFILHDIGIYEIK